MIPFLVAEALRRARRGRRPGASSPHQVPMRHLVAGELVHAARVGLRRPALLVVLSGVAVAAGVHVALGTTYPGPVAPEPLRWTLSLAVLLATGGLARSSPATWGDVGRSLRRSRLILAGLGLAGAVSLVKVGLHDTTPGPVLPAGARWTVVVVLATVTLGLAARGRMRP